jgi:hypothetical protein
MDVWQIYVRLIEELFQDISEVVIDENAVGWDRILIQQGSIEKLEL